MNYGVLLGVDYMRVQKIAVTGFESKLDALHKIIGCEMVEPVRVAGLPKSYVMIVDEEGLLKENVSLNIIGSYLYGMLKHGQPIVGNAVIIKEVETVDGIDWEWLTKEEADKLEKKICQKIWPKAVMEISAYVREQRGEVC